VAEAAAWSRSERSRALLVAAPRLRWPAAQSAKAAISSSPLGGWGTARHGSLALMADCLFCRIVAQEIPSEEALSTPRTYAFFDINPEAPVHVLVVPRQHITNAAELNQSHAETLAEMFTAAHSVAVAQGIADSGYRLVFNVGDDAVNTVPHLHLHVMGGRQMGWPPG
jgi:histidine triad (HIT) family protein